MRSQALAGNTLTGNSEVAPFLEDTLQLVLRSRNGALVYLESGFQAGKNIKDAGSSSIGRMSPGAVHYLSFSFNGNVWEEVSRTAMQD